jgi:hypothetical protein
MIEVPIEQQSIPIQKPKPRLYQVVESNNGKNSKWDALGIYDEEDLSEVSRIIRKFACVLHSSIITLYLGFHATALHPNTIQFFAECCAFTSMSRGPALFVDWI